MEKTGLDRKKTSSRKLAVQFNRINKKAGYWFTRYYYHQIRLMTRWKKTACLLLVLAFGLPVFMLPDKIKVEEIDPASRWLKPAEKYNEMVNKPVYKEKIKPVINQALGGSLRLFAEKVYEGSYFTRSEETVLSVSASMPNGTTIEQMNHLVSRMEAFLSGFEEIKQFQTNIHNARQAYIAIHFTKESERSGFPYLLKSRIISKALELGGGSWNVWGLMDQGFSNNVRENAGSYRIVMYGYNYDELYVWAEQLREKLLEARRIQSVTINSEFSWWKDDYLEFYFDLNKARIAQENIHPVSLYSSLQPLLGSDIHTGSILYEKEKENLKLLSRQSYTYDVWNILNTTQWIQDRPYKLSELAAVEKAQTPQNVVRVNQQYRLCLQYEYIGANNQGNRIQERILREFNQQLPMGYTAQKEDYEWYWGQKDKKQYLLLALIVVIIFFTTSILFNSLKQPLAVIFVIPISYIGVFLTFYWFKLNFDQGGFASFVILCGITVNASIYILNQYNQIRSKNSSIPLPKAYLKAWNAKIVPIFLTVISTILGFIPFMIGSQKEGFWFPLAVGTIGGLIMSVIGIFFYLPLFTLKKKDFN